MLEINLNSGEYHKIKQTIPCFCMKCKNEIKRNEKGITFTLNGNEYSYVFCKKCKEKLNDYAISRLAFYGNNVIEEFMQKENS